MAIDITLASNAVRTTTSKPGGASFLEVDNEATEAAVDLGDNRACSVELVVNSPDLGMQASLDASIETSADNTSWRTVRSFEGVRGASSQLSRQRVSFVADRYIRLRYCVFASRGSSTKTGIKFSCAGRAVGGA